jgi:hypothetical protein
LNKAKHGLFRTKSLNVNNKSEDIITLNDEEDDSLDSETNSEESEEFNGTVRDEISMTSQNDVCCFLPILRKMISMNTEKKRLFIKLEAPEDFIHFLRGITQNCDRFILNNGDHWTINHSRTFRSITNKSIRPDRIRKFMTRYAFLHPFSRVLPQMIFMIKS